VLKEVNGENGEPDVQTLGVRGRGRNQSVLAPPLAMPVPGHEMVRRIDVIGAMVEKLSVGRRVGILWLGHTCGICPYCLGGDEDLCDRPIFTGYAHDGGFATATIADARFAFPFGEAGDDVSLAPLLCADLIEERRPGDLTWSPWGGPAGTGALQPHPRLGAACERMPSFGLSPIREGTQRIRDDRHPEDSLGEDTVARDLSRHHPRYGYRRIQSVLPYPITIGRSLK